MRTMLLFVALAPLLVLAQAKPPPNSGSGGGVSTATAPLVVTGSDVALPAAGAGQSGYLTNAGGLFSIDAGLTVVGGITATGQVTGAFSGATYAGTAPIVVTGSGGDGGTIVCTAATTSTAGCVSASAQVLSGAKTFPDGIDVTSGLTTRGAQTSASLRLFDSTNSKTWFFINHNNVLEQYGTDGSTIVLGIEGGTGAISNFASTKNRGTCTLNGGTPSTCTATVNASAKCLCSPVGATAIIAAGGCGVGVASTTLTITGPATATNDVNYHCF